MEWPISRQEFYRASFSNSAPWQKTHREAWSRRAIAGQHFGVKSRSVISAGHPGPTPAKSLHTPTGRDRAPPRMKRCALLHCSYTMLMGGV